MEADRFEYPFLQIRLLTGALAKTADPDRRLMIVSHIYQLVKESSKYVLMSISDNSISSLLKSGHTLPLPLPLTLTPTHSHSPLPSPSYSHSGGIRNGLVWHEL